MRICLLQIRGNIFIVDDKVSCLCGGNTLLAALRFSQLTCCQSVVELLLFPQHSVMVTVSHGSCPLVLSVRHVSALQLGVAPPQRCLPFMGWNPGSNHWGDWVTPLATILIYSMDLGKGIQQPSMYDLMMGNWFFYMNFNLTLYLTYYAFWLICCF